MATMVSYTIVRNYNNNNVNEFNIIKSENKGLNPNFVTGYVDGSKKRNKYLVVWGRNLTSTVEDKLTSLKLAKLQLAPYQYSVFIGLLLSDGWLSFSNARSKNAILGFLQSRAHLEYFFICIFIFISLL